MKHKLIITETQYQALLQSINEQTYMSGGKPRKTRRKTGFTTKMTRVPQWLEKIIGNKVDGYKTPLKSDADLDAILKGEDMNVYLTPEYIKKLTDITKQNKFYIKDIIKTNPKYLAALIKLMVVNDFVFTTLLFPKRTPVTTTTPPPPSIPPKDLPVDDRGPMEFPLDGTGKQYFDDNEWVLNDEFKTQFKTQITDKIKEQLAQGVLQDLTGLTIDTSCSRLRNGIPKNSPGHEKWSRRNKRITFPELSVQRNNAAKQYVIQELSNLGIDTSKINIGQNTLGDNKDGTSGPDYTGGNRVDYNQYKFLKIKVGFGKKIDGSTEVRPIPGKTDVGTKSSYWLYQAVLISPNIPYKLPGIWFTDVWDPKIEQTTEKCKVDSKGNTQCGVEPGKFTTPKDWSTDPNDPAYRGPSKQK